MPELDAHQLLVKHLAKPGDEIVAEMTPEKAHLLHMVLGAAGEIGELVDTLKKHVIYNQTLDMSNIIEELGDLEFYLEGLRQGLGLQRETTITLNISKLTKRYPTGTYRNEDAKTRADKAQGAKEG